MFELQDRVSESVAAAIEPTLQFAEIGRLQRDQPARLDAYDLLLRAYALLSDFTAASMDAALDCLDQALAIDPVLRAGNGGGGVLPRAMPFPGMGAAGRCGPAKAVSLAWRAVELAPNDAQVLWMAAFAIWNMAQTGRERARELFGRSLLINPNSAMALTLAGWIETMCGNQAAGREMVARAQRLNPRDPRGWFMSGVMAIAAVIDENYAEARDVGGTGARAEPAFRGGAPRACGCPRQAWARGSRAENRPGSAGDRAGTNHLRLFRKNTGSSRKHGESLRGRIESGRIAGVTGADADDGVTGHPL